ncbi:hypothetical protein [Clostridium thailandense]|uniref:Uncharacterized protein n=1 Tax=Clostridium thailandense TaxID=2794346 RepID=A0A949WSP6_9CLOT|nr:hypothetical protein [Clostridium thailandense]MBV7275316.1 hypothetical protein [Clostridium thailandense]MCH5135832.1 hypothetical protein [Clostridiaceae bacterium UIB06]
MKQKYSVIIEDKKSSCTVKQVSQNTYDQIHNMIKNGADDMKILNSLTEITTTEDNIVLSGVSTNEAIGYVSDSGQNYVIVHSI